MNVIPAIVIVPVRLPTTCGETMNWTVPGPAPFPPEGAVTVMKLLLLMAVHVHPAAVVTVTVPVPPATPNDWDIGEIE